MRIQPVEKRAYHIFEAGKMSRFLARLLLLNENVPMLNA